METLLTVILILLKIVVLLVPLLVGVAYLTFAERKIIGYMQVRLGPNRVGPTWRGQSSPPIATGFSPSHGSAIFCINPFSLCLPRRRKPLFLQTRKPCRKFSTVFEYCW